MIIETILKLCIHRYFILIVRCTIQKKSGPDSVSMYLPVTESISRQDS